MLIPMVLKVSYMFVLATDGFAAINSSRIIPVLTINGCELLASAVAMISSIVLTSILSVTCGSDWDVPWLTVVDAGNARFFFLAGVMDTNETPSRESLEVRSDQVKSDIQWHKGTLYNTISDHIRSDHIRSYHILSDDISSAPILEIPKAKVKYNNTIIPGTG